jgi:hypothetical protein
LNQVSTCFVIAKGRQLKGSVEPIDGVDGIELQAELYGPLDLGNFFETFLGGEVVAVDEGWVRNG